MLLSVNFTEKGHLNSRISLILFLEKRNRIYLTHLSFLFFFLWFHVLLFLLLLLLLSRFSHVQLCATQWIAAHQAPPSLGFSRQEHWSGLPFLSPMHESEKWKWSHSVVSNSSLPHGLQPTRLLRPWNFPGKSTGVGCHCLLWLFLLLRVIGQNWSCPTPNCAWQINHFPLIYHWLVTTVQCWIKMKRSRK